MESGEGFKTGSVFKPALLIKVSLKKGNQKKKINYRLRTEEQIGNGVDFAVILKYSS